MLLLDKTVTDLSSAAVRHHGDGSLNAQGLTLTVAKSLHFILKLRHSDQTWLTCTETHPYTHTYTTRLWAFKGRGCLIWLDFYFYFKSKVKA